MVRHPGWAAVALTALALTVTACGNGSVKVGSAYGNQATATTPAPSPVPAVVLKTEPTQAGMVLASGSGLTLYYFSADKPGSGTSVCTGGCAAAWPPLAAPVKAPASVRLPGPLGMITRPGGARQVTLNGLPLYLYVGDKAPGQVTGDGIHGVWHVIKLGASRPVKVLKVAHTPAGTVLASSRGLTLYTFSKDKRGSGTSVCTGGCAAAWPPLAAPVKAPASVRLPGKLGSIIRPGGFRQVTLNGLPLYLYVGDKAPGQVTGDGIHGVWHVIKITMS
jgi:predicted lipoprotein with Yx(FWY)xxD motif